MVAEFELEGVPGVGDASVSVARVLKKRYSRDNIIFCRGEASVERADSYHKFVFRMLRALRGQPVNNIGGQAHAESRADTQVRSYGWV